MIHFASFSASFRFTPAASERGLAEGADSVGEFLLGDGCLVAGALTGVVDSLYRTMQELGDLHTVVETQAHERIYA